LYGFQPGRDLYAYLDSWMAFRPHSAWETVQGRSWAIKDGALGQSFAAIMMYKRVGHYAGVITYPHAVW
jgi:hypothetical protein